MKARTISSYKEPLGWLNFFPFSSLKLEAEETLKPVTSKSNLQFTPHLIEATFHLFPSPPTFRNPATEKLQLFLNRGS